MNRGARIQLYCAYSCYAFIALFLLGFGVFAGFIPPPPPSDSPEQIAAMFRANTTGIRIGMCICLLSSALLLTWGGAVIVQLRRIEGRHTALIYGWIAAIGALSIEFIFPFMIWALAAFRPDDDPVLIQRFNDLAWLLFLGVISTAMFQAVVLGALTLLDERPEPVYPRWFGYFLLWDVLLFLPAGMIMFFKDGPLAWNGVFAWWIAISAAGAWMVMTTVVTVAAIKRQAAETHTFESHGGEPNHLGPSLDERLAIVEAQLRALRSSG